MNEIYEVAVIGGGPAGMMAAGRAAELGARVVLIEKNASLGKKLLITGGGRCNVTNATFDDRKLLENFKENGKFLFSAFSQFSVKETLAFFNSKDMPTKIENENRVFPETDSAVSVLNVLLKYLRDGSVTVLTDSAVKEIRTSDNVIKSVVLKSGSEIIAKSFILATGGKSYPETGSTGDGFEWLKEMGHDVSKADSALVPVNIYDKWVKDLQGVSLTDIKINLFQAGNKMESKKGKILFTHFGVSGPTILNLSRKISELIPYGDVCISLDLLPQHDFATLNEALQRLFKENDKKKFKNTLLLIIPSAMVPIITEMAGIDGETANNSITREQRIKLMHVLKDVRMKVQSLMSPEHAIVSSGGLEPTEVDFKTMRSKKISNLYVTGDILNINRPSGGFSLQLCWTTGFVAGTHSVKSQAMT